MMHRPDASTGISDVAVIGAGPAGAWTAHLLASGGARVALFDPSHPREKPCGGGVTGRALALVNSAIAGELPAVAVRRARLIDPATGDAAIVALRDGLSHGTLSVSSRRTFDGLLVSAARAAGAAVIASRVRTIERERDRWRLQLADGTDHRANFIVGADGANSFTKRHVAQAFRRDQLSVATGFCAHGATSTEIAIEFTVDPPGYIWSFPRPDHLAIGVCAEADAGHSVDQLRARVRDWIRARGVANDDQLEPYSWPIPSLSARDFAALEVAGPGWLLVGDAAGLVDPITREGIFFALQSAAFASDALLSRRNVERQYAARVRAEIVDELVRAARFKARFFQPRFISLLVDALARSSAIQQVMADLVAGTQGYRGLKRRLVRTWEFKLALRALRLGLARPRFSAFSADSADSACSATASFGTCRTDSDRRFASLDGTIQRV